MGAPRLQTIGWILIVLGVLAEVFALIARFASKGIPAGLFSSRIGGEIVVSPVIVVIGILLVSGETKKS